MKRWVGLALAVLLALTGVTALAEESAARALVVYFSRAGENYNVGVIEEGNTAKLAAVIAEETGAALFAMEPVTPYPADYDTMLTVATEEKNTNARPAYLGDVSDWAACDVVYLGYPIWWGGVPQIVYSFLDAHDFTGKTVIPFNTHEGSGQGGTHAELAAYLPQAVFLPGLAVRGSKAQRDERGTREDVQTWLRGLENEYSAK